MTAYPFLSDEWIEAARQLRARYADQVPPPPVPVTLNVIVTEIPHRDEALHGHIDTTDGQTIIEQGHLDEAELTITVDYDVAKAAFVTQDQQAVMQAFLQGRILVDGDAGQLLAFQASQVRGAEVEDVDAAAIHAEMLAFTAED